MLDYGKYMLISLIVFGIIFPIAALVLELKDHNGHYTMQSVKVFEDTIAFAKINGDLSKLLKLPPFQKIWCNYLISLEDQLAGQIVLEFSKFDPKEFGGFWDHHCFTSAMIKATVEIREDHLIPVVDNVSFGRFPFVHRGDTNEILLRQLANNVELWTRWTFCEICGDTSPKKLDELSQIDTVWKVIHQECLETAIHRPTTTIIATIIKKLQSTFGWEGEKMEEMGEMGEMGEMEEMEMEMEMKEQRQKQEKKPLVTFEEYKMALERFNKNDKVIEQTFWVTRLLTWFISINKIDYNVIIKEIDMLFMKPELLCPWAIKSLSTAIIKSDVNELLKPWIGNLARLYRLQFPFLIEGVFSSRPYNELCALPTELRRHWARKQIVEKTFPSETLPTLEDIVNLLESTGELQGRDWILDDQANVLLISKICGIIVDYYKRGQKLSFQWNWSQFNDLFIIKNQPPRAFEGLKLAAFKNACLGPQDWYIELFSANAK